MKVIIFGGEGFVGKALQRELTWRNIEFLSVSRSSDISVDISNYEDFSKITPDYYDVIVNCATVLPGGDYLDSSYLDKLFLTNVRGTQNICRWVASQNKRMRVVNCSTLVVNKKPWPLKLDESACAVPSGRHVLYSCSKLFQEGLFETLQELNTADVVHLRFSAIYGQGMPWNGVLCSLLEKAKNIEPIDLLNGDRISFDFINVVDVAKIIGDFISNSAIGTFNAASGQEVFLKDLAELIVGLSFSESVVSNNNQENFKEDRAQIDVSKLNAFYATEKFIRLDEGIKDMIK